MRIRYISAMKPSEKYSARKINFVGIHSNNGWQLKTYNILYKDRVIDDELVGFAQEFAVKVLPQPATTTNRYGLGFVSIHQGKTYDFVAIGYWLYDTELKLTTYLRGSSTSKELQAVASDEISHDIWDIRLMSFEAESWAKHMLMNTTAEPEKYLTDVLIEEI